MVSLAIKMYNFLFYWSTPSINDASPSTINLTLPLKCCTISNTQLGLVTTSGEALIFQLSKVDQVLTTRAIKTISCNSTMSCLISDIGQTFVAGSDPQKHGLLGIQNCYDTPLRPILANIVASNVSVGLTHAGLIDRTGNLYTWGSGNGGELGSLLKDSQQPPSIVHSAKVFKVKQVVCGPGFTAICTSGGFLYVYGILPACSNLQAISHQPYSVKTIEKLFVQQIVYCENFVAVLTDNKDAYAVHSCLNPVKLPFRYKCLAGSQFCVYGVTKDKFLLHEWKVGSRKSCGLQGLEGKNYVFEDARMENFQIYSGYHLGIAFSSHFPVEKTITPRVFSNLRVNAEPDVEVLRSSQKKMKDSIRKNAVQKIIRVFTGFFMDKKMVALNKVRNAVKIKKISEISVNLLQLVHVIEKIWQRNRMVSMNLSLKAFHYYKISVENSERKEKMSKLGNFFALLERKQIKYKRIKSGIEIINKIYVNMNLELSFNILAKLFYEYNTKFNVINQILSFVSSKNTRILVLKYFELWKKHRISSKIAEISKKYSDKSRARTIALKLHNFQRRNTKFALTQLKEYKKPKNTAKYGLVLLVPLLKNHQSDFKQFAFRLIFAHSFRKKRVFLIFNSFIKQKLSFCYYLIRSYIEERKQYHIMKLNLKLTSAFEKYEFKQLAKAFNQMKIYDIKNMSQLIDKQDSSLSLSIDSPLSALTKARVKSPIRTQASKVITLMPISIDKKKSQAMNKTIKSEANKKGSKSPNKSKPGEKTIRFSEKSKTSKNLAGFLKNSFESIPIEEEVFKETGKKGYLEKYQKDFAGDEVRIKIGLTSLEKTLSKTLAGLNVFVFSLLKSSKSLAKKKIDLNFLDSDSDKTPNYFNISEMSPDKLEETCPNIWESQIYSLGLNTVRKVLLNVIKGYFKLL